MAIIMFSSCLQVVSSRNNCNKLMPEKFVVYEVVAVTVAGRDHSTQPIG